MNTIRSVAVVVSYVIGSLVVQPSGAQSPVQEKIQLPSGSLPIDTEKLINSIRESYYHPDDLSALECTVSVDWSGVPTGVKTDEAQARLKVLNDVRVHSKAARDKVPELTFDWGSGTFNAKEQMESAIKQMINGFYQMYWPLIGSFPLQKPSEVKKITQEADGLTLESVEGNASIVLKANKDNLPIRYNVDSPVMKAVMEPSYSPSPNPIPGDRSRLTGLKATDQFGNSTINLVLSLDYQSLGGFNIPHKITLTVSPTVSIPMEFSNCTVSKIVQVAPPVPVTPATN
ncbi:MAG: hypothetical protein JSS95_06640 [Acidobacteria bacterium]|nr:hypothetical protein [Acidobacteriota bacterium]